MSCLGTVHQNRCSVKTKFSAVDTTLSQTEMVLGDSVMRAPIIAAAAALGLVLAGCSTSAGTPVPIEFTANPAATVTVTKAADLGKQVFDQKAVEAGVVQLIRTSYNMAATSADCPKAGDTEVKAGNTFSCTITIDDGDKSVTITVKDDRGTYEVGLPN